VKGVRDVHEKLLCLRSLNPTSIAICILDGKCIGKVKSMEAATTLLNKRECVNDTKALNVLRGTNLYKYTAPEVRKM